MIIIFLGTLGLTAFLVKSTIKLVQTKILGHYLRKIRMFSSGASTELSAESGIYVKIFMNYVQIISVITTFRLETPEILKSIIETSANPTQ